MTRHLVFVALLAGCESDYNVRAEGPQPDLPDPTVPVGSEQVDRFVQTASTESDVLFVVDNSGSMDEEQDRLAVNFPRMLQWFEDSEIDWRIGVISTDMYDPDQAGALRTAQGVRWIEPTTPSADAVFAGMVSLGTEGANDEQGRAAAYTALELRRDESNAGFLRDDAYLHVILMSDEDDNSSALPVSLPEFVEFLRYLKPQTQHTTFSSIVGLEDAAGQPGCQAEIGTEYLEITRSVGGVQWSICSEDWEPLLDELGFVTSGYRRDFQLSRIPDPATIEVSVEADGEVVDHPTPGEVWVYTQRLNAVTFVAEVPPPEAIVEVRYTVVE